MTSELVTGSMLQLGQGAGVEGGVVRGEGGVMVEEVGVGEANSKH